MSTKNTFYAEPEDTAPAKVSDSRSKNWTGETCQLEALPPDQIAYILRAAIQARFDYDQLAHDQSTEERDRMMISGLLPAPDRTGGL